MSPPIGFTVSTEPSSVRRQSSTLEPVSSAKVPADIIYNNNNYYLLFMAW